MHWCYRLILVGTSSDVRDANFDSGVVSEGPGFNLCVAPFLNVCVPNFRLESISWSCSELVGVVMQGSELSRIG